MSNQNNTGAYPTIERSAFYPGLVSGITPAQEREGGSQALQAGNKPALVLAGLIVALAILRLVWEGAK